jgi:hypothetical protein
VIKFGKLVMASTVGLCSSGWCLSINVIRASIGLEISHILTRHVQGAFSRSKSQ